MDGDSSVSTSAVRLADSLTAANNGSFCAVRRAVGNSSAPTLLLLPLRAKVRPAGGEAVLPDLGPEHFAALPIFTLSWGLVVVDAPMEPLASVSDFKVRERSASSEIVKTSRSGPSLSAWPSARPLGLPLFSPLSSGLDGCWRAMVTRTAANNRVASGQLIWHSSHVLLTALSNSSHADLLSSMEINRRPSAFIAGGARPSRPASVPSKPPVASIMIAVRQRFSREAVHPLAQNLLDGLEGVLRSSSTTWLISRAMGYAAFNVE